MAKKTDSKLTVETLTHEEATRKNIPTAEYQSVMRKGIIGSHQTNPSLQIIIVENLGPKIDLYRVF